MNISVSMYEDTAAFSDVAGEFLRSQPVHHNLILTRLDGRQAVPGAGRYWVVMKGGQAAGVEIQTDPARFAMIVPMDRVSTIALVDAIVDGGVVLPGVFGDVATAASFAGRWTERFKSAATPTHGSRLYELQELNAIGTVKGKHRKADESDRKLAEAWLKAFQTETLNPTGNIDRLVDGWLTEGQLWLWQDGEPVSMVVAQKPIVEVARLSTVYTPPKKRRRGYAAACVHTISKKLTEAGLHCILYTDLGNPTSNSIYRRMGYRAIAEGIHYRFNRT
jgi:ribosomal protein S18 acetylase RimI-like enzyme